MFILLGIEAKIRRHFSMEMQGLGGGAIIGHKGSRRTREGQKEGIEGGWLENESG